MMAAACACSALMRGMEMLCAASVTATITPVSCKGRKPFGTATYRKMVPARVATATSSIAPWWRSE